MCGFLFPIVLLLFYMLAISFSPHFDFTENWFSDLGGIIPSSTLYIRPQATTPFVALIYNIGLVISGILGLVFAYGLRKSILVPSGRLGALFFSFGSLSLLSAGIIPISFGIFHSIICKSFFVLMPLSILFIGITILNSHQRLLGYFTIILGLGSLLFGDVLIIYRAMSEVIALFSLTVFNIIYAMKIWKRNSLFSK